jgi:hypothetical protein
MKSFLKKDISQWKMGLEALTLLRKNLREEFMGILLTQMTLQKFKMNLMKFKIQEDLSLFKEIPLFLQIHFFQIMIYIKKENFEFSIY